MEFGFGVGFIFFLLQSKALAMLLVYSILKQKQKYGEMYEFKKEDYKCYLVFVRCKFDCANSKLTIFIGN